MLVTQQTTTSREAWYVHERLGYEYCAACVGKLHEIDKHTGMVPSFRLIWGKPDTETRCDICGTNQSALEFDATETLEFTRLKIF